MMALSSAIEVAATVEERIALARELGDIARVLDGRRGARADVLDLDAEARRRGRR